MVVLHTSLNVLWGTWEIAALPPQKEVFDVAGSLEEAHRARLKQKTKNKKHTACLGDSSLQAKLNVSKDKPRGCRNLRLLFQCRNYGSRTHWERPEHSQCSKRSWCKAEVRCERQRWGKSDRRCWARVHGKQTHLSYERLKGLKIQRAQ